MSRVLFLTQVLPYPLHSGAKIRAYYVLRHLARRHDVTLLSFVRGDDDPRAVAHLAAFCSHVRTVPMKRSPLRDARALLKSSLTGQPVIIARDEIPAMHAALRQLMLEGDFDVVHADQTAMAQYALYARTIAPDEARRPSLLLDAHNALYRIPQRMARHEANPLRRLLMQREARLLRRYERQAYDRFDHVTFVTDVDRQILGLDRRASTIPICVDPDRKPLVQRQPHPSAVTHLGTMFWPPNVEGVLWFAQEIWPRVAEAVPAARLSVIGKDPPQEVRDLRQHLSRIDVTGYVPDPQPYLAETAVFIVPLRAAGGMRVKILDAWSWGLPIVSTSIGAEGIHISDGVNILIADEPAAFADAVASILLNPALGERLRENGRRWVQEHYDWRRVYPLWDRVYDALT